MACQPVETLASPPSSFSDTSRSALMLGKAPGSLTMPAFGAPST